MRRPTRLALLTLGLLGALMLAPAVAFGHPGIGIVRNSRGDIFYTDLTHVWKVAPNGERSIAVRNVHTHELYLDAQDNLFGEHLWYEGEATDRWGHRVWRLAPDGALTDVIPARRGFRDDFDDFHFVRDAAGAFYWADSAAETNILRRSTDGKTTTIASGGFRDVRGMTVSPDGTLYVIDLHDLISISPAGGRRLLVRNLANRRQSSLGEVDRHAIMGVWTDRAGNVYAAVMSDRAVKKVTPDGRVTIVTRAEGDWIATGGLVTPDGGLWLLEVAKDNAVRVRRVGR